MPENNIPLRSTTISLDEYNKLQSEIALLREQKGVQQQTISQLQNKVNDLEQKQPQVKVTHWSKEYDDYDDEEFTSLNKVEFINLSEVTTIANNKAKKETKDKVEELENKIQSEKNTAKYLRERIEANEEEISALEKRITKLVAQREEELEEKEETYNKNIKSLEKAYKEDEKNYKETIKELKEEIQKVKDSKTDEEVEEKRNKEIKDLKARIKDLEKLVEELGSMNFFKRVFKLRTISAEKLAVQKELLERERNANAIGTTWVRENSKYRKYNSFNEMMISMMNGMKTQITNRYTNFF
jgi:chromosome segregation ATPase